MAKKQLEKRYFKYCHIRRYKLAVVVAISHLFEEKKPVQRFLFICVCASDANCNRLVNWIVLTFAVSQVC